MLLVSQMAQRQKNKGSTVIARHRNQNRSVARIEASRHEIRVPGAAILKVPGAACLQQGLEAGRQRI
ncbi:MAG: hypothetical protein RIM84_18440 [Alphaproteobacteria bacterium]